MLPGPAAEAVPLALRELPALKPPLKWAGGKRWLVPHMRPLWQPHARRRYVEPFCGGLALPLAFRPQRALLSDVNVHLIGFYRCLQAGLTIDTPLHNDRDIYYQYRRAFNRLIEEGKVATPEASILFYYLNRTGYNGLCRFNQRGEFNVPFGSHKKIHYRSDFHDYRAALSEWNFVVEDFERLPLQDDDFVYADPPYDVEFVHYFRDPFRWEDQVRLAEWLACHRGPVMASNQATERIIRLYERLGFQLVYLDAPRMISRDGNRARAREVLAMRNLQ